MLDAIQKPGVAGKELVASRIMIIEEGIIITQLDAKKPGQLSIHFDLAVVADIISGNALKTIHRGPSAKQVGLLPYHEGIGDIQQPAVTERMLNERIEGVAL